MKPKHVAFIITILALTGLTMRAQEFKPGEFQVDVFGQVATPDLDSERTSYGFGVSYFIGESLGVGVRTSFDELSGHLFESVSPRLLWRVPLQSRHALYAFFQGTRTFHGNTGWSAEAGPGYEFRPIEHVSIYSEIGMRKHVAGPNRDTDTYGTGEVGLRLSW